MNNEAGHLCPVCGATWAAETCYKYSAGCNQWDSPCPNCYPRAAMVPWRYEDVFLTWARKMRESAKNE